MLNVLLEKTFIFNVDYLLSKYEFEPCSMSHVHLH